MVYTLPGVLQLGLQPYAGAGDLLNFMEMLIPGIKGPGVPNQPWRSAPPVLQLPGLELL